MDFREGDLIETSDRSLFDVKGLIHPPSRIIAFIRYFPCEKGNRKRGETAYGKVYSLANRFRWLEENFPQYIAYDDVFGERLCEVPVEDVKRHYRPVEKLRELREAVSLDDLESKAVRLAEILKSEAVIPWNAVGISGSIMAGLHDASSDIDPIVYGSENCRKIYSVLKMMLRDNREQFKPYNRSDLKTLFDFRSKDTKVGFEDFVRTESRKCMQGKFMGTDYFVRFVKDWREIDEKYGDVVYKNVGYSRIEAQVVDDSEAIFTPCTYKIADVKTIEGAKVDAIGEIVSFRGRFCEQTVNGEIVVAQGKVEHIKDIKHGCEGYRLLIGNKPSDYLITLDRSSCRSTKSLPQW